MTTGDVRRNFLCSSCYEDLVTLQREYEIMRMDPQDLEDLGEAINMSRPEDPPIPEQPLVASRTSLGRFPVSAADRAAANGASSSSAPAEQPVDNQQEALLQGVGFPMPSYQDIMRAQWHVRCVCVETKKAYYWKPEPSLPCGSL